MNMKWVVALLASAVVASQVCALAGGEKFTGAAKTVIRPVSDADAKEIALPRSYAAGLWDKAVHVALGPLDLAEISQQDAKRLSEEKTLRIGVERDLPDVVALSKAKSRLGQWIALDDGSHVWRLTVGAEGAFGLRVHVAGLNMPDVCELRTFDAQDPVQTRGPYTNASLKRRANFWTGTVFSGSVTLECYCPPGVAPSDVAFTVDKIVHVYRNPENVAKEGTCHNDVTCFPDWTATANGVAGIGSLDNHNLLWCTGCLLNDLDDTTFVDYFMTANHCVSGQSEADDTEFYWFYQTATCNGTVPSLASVPRTDGGADYLAGQTRASGNDFAFLQLRTPPPSGVSYVGWATENPAIGEAVTAIHHPDGAYKRISFATIKAATTSDDYWGVEFNSGVTEPGSSGSPLFNVSTQFIGQLWGGSSACDYQSGNDLYGRFDVSYQVINPWLTGFTLGKAVDLDAQAIIWKTSDDAPWFGTVNPTHDGVDAARSGPINNSQQSRMETELAGPGTLSFWWKVSCEDAVANNYDFLAFEVDGVEKFRIDGEVDWQQKSVTLGAGTHRVSWVYSKDGERFAGQDCGWVDQVAYEIAIPYAVEAEALPWATGGNAPWIGQFMVSTDGVDSAQSTIHGNSQQSWMETTVVGPGSLSFYWKVSCEDAPADNYDYLAVIVDGVEQFRIDGEVDWEQRSVALTGGSHTVRWLYRKDASQSLGSDCGWVDQVTYDMGIPVAVDAETLTWVTDGAADWFGQIATTHDRTDAAQNGDIDDGESSGIETVVTGPGQLSFWWKVSSEDGWDFLRFSIDGVEQTGAITGQTDWQRQDYALGAGDHTIRWDYTKDGSVSEGDDSGWVDQVSFFPLGAPVITLEPKDMVVSSGQAATLTVAAAGDAALTYQWFSGMSGDTRAPVVGATGATYVVPPVSATTPFWVRVANAKGASDSLAARVWKGFEVRSLADLKKIGSGVGGWTLGAAYKLMNDIDAAATASWNDEGFAPIGKPKSAGGQPFNGAFDGNGFVVRNLWINRPYESYVGFFGDLGTAAQVRDFGLVGGSVTGSVNVGVLAAQSQGRIERCYAASTVAGFMNVGGLIGEQTASGALVQSYASGQVTGVQGVGGLLGVGAGAISQCYATGTVSGDENIGGLLGYSDAVLENCRATGAVSGTEYVGGLIGAGGAHGDVRRCYATGAVLGDTFVGGLAGYVSDGLVVHSYALGTVTGIDTVGGLVGLNEGEILQCYAAGLTKGSISFGGLVGDLMGAVTESYWDTETSLQGASVGGEGKTTAQMMQMATFVSWDFVAVWSLSEGTGYPYLLASSTRVLTFDSQGGSPVSSVIVTVGHPYGTLPGPVRSGYVFGGWWTGPDGAGVNMMAPTIVSASGAYLLYAKWALYVAPPVLPPAQPPQPPQPPAQVDPLRTVGSFGGCLYADRAFDGHASVPAVRGTLSLTVSTLAGKLSAKVIVQSGALVFNATAWQSKQTDGAYHAILKARTGEVLDLYVRQNTVWGTLLPRVQGGESLTVGGNRNRFAERTDLAARAALESFRGYYTVALPVADALSLGAAEAAPEGSGYVTLTVGNGGSVKIAGVLADGTRLSQSSTLLLADGVGPEACVTLFAPLYNKKGWVSGVLWIDPVTRTVTTDFARGWFVRWEKPGMGPDGFSERLNADGGFYTTIPSLAAHYRFSAEAGDVSYHYAGGGEAGVQEAAVPSQIGVSVNGLQLAMTKGVKPTFANGVYEYSAENCAGTTLSFTASTGLFKGGFSLFYDFDLNGRLQHRAVSVPYAGVLTTVRDAAFMTGPAGQGHCLVPDNDPAVRAYQLKRSFKVELEAAP